VDQSKSNARLEMAAAIVTSLNYLGSKTEGGKGAITRPFLDTYKQHLYMEKK
jgi:hypothetical protein